MPRMIVLALALTVLRVAAFAVATPHAAAASASSAGNGLAPVPACLSAIPLGTPPMNALIAANNPQAAEGQLSVDAPAGPIDSTDADSLLRLCGYEAPEIVPMAPPPPIMRSGHRVERASSELLRS